MSIYFEIIAFQVSKEPLKHKEQTPVEVQQTADNSRNTWNT